MENCDSRTAPSPEAASDDSASPVNRQPGEPADRLAFEPVPLRYRGDGLTPERQREYVEALADTGVAREAAARVGLSEQGINRVRRRIDARSFDRACEAAHRFGAARLRSVAYERAIEGTLKGHYYHGERISQERVYDNRLLIYLLGKAERLLEEPDDDSRSICRNWEPFMEALEQGLPPPDLAPADAPRAAEAAEASGPDEDISDKQVWVEEGVWWTLFPPPEDFDGEEEGELGDSDYQRTLTEEEESVMRARQRAGDEVDLARCCAMRDRFFGLPDRGAPDFFGPREAETNETSDPFDPDLGPIEYKSLVPPRPAPSSVIPAEAGIRDHDRSRLHRRGSGIPDRVRDDEGPCPARFDKRPALRRRHIQIPTPRHPYR